MTGFRPSLRRPRVVLDRRARADEVTIAVNIVDPPDRTPVFVSARGTCGKAALGAGIGPRPSVVGDVVHRMWRWSSGEASTFQRPDSISAISRRIAIMASQNRSSSAFDSDSVGSIISVPGTGKLMVGAWKP